MSNEIPTPRTRLLYERQALLCDVMSSHEMLERELAQTKETNERLLKSLKASPAHPALLSDFEKVFDDLRVQLAQCQKERDAYEHGAHMFNEWCGNSYEWDALTDLEKQRWNRLAWRSRSNNEQLTQARREAEDHDRWLREMLADYRIEFDDHTVGRRLALNQFIHDLRAELEAANQAAVGMRTALKSNQSVLEWLAGAAGNDVIPPSADGTPAWHIIDGALTQIAIALSSPVGQGYARREVLEKIVTESEAAMSFDEPRNVAGTWLNEIRSIALAELNRTNPLPAQQDAPAIVL